MSTAAVFRRTCERDGNKCNRNFFNWTQSPSRLNYHVIPRSATRGRQKTIVFLKSAKSFVSTCFSEHNFYYAAQNGNEGSWFYSTGGILIKGNKYLKERWAKCKRWVDRHQWHNYESHSRKEIKSQERKNILLIPKEKFKKFTTRIYFST